MPSPTFEELQDEVLARDYGSTADRTIVKLMLNAANRDVHGAFRWSWAETTAALTSTAGVEVLAIPAAAVWIGRIRPASATTPQLSWVDPGTVNSNSPLATFNPTSTQRGMPVYVTRWGNNLYLDPTPDLSTYTWTLYYWKGATAMTVDADEPDVPPVDREVLVYGALIRMAERDRNVQASESWKAMYTAKLEQMKNKDTLLFQGRRTVKMPPSYNGRYGG